MSINLHKVISTIVFIFTAVISFHGFAQAASDNDAVCNSIAAILRDVPGSAVEISNKGDGCVVSMKGSWSAIEDGLFPPNLLDPDSEGSALKKDGWDHDIGHDADGPDGTVFAIRKGNVICIVTGSWDGGDDSDPSYVPDDGYDITVECEADED